MADVMSNGVKWQDSKLDVQAQLIPRFLWTTASIDVFLGGQCILRTGRRMKFTGSHSTTFTHSGSIHTAELSWGRSGLSWSFPYQLRIDGVPVADSSVHVRNWPLGLIAGILLAAVLVMIFSFYPFVTGLTFAPANVSLALWFQSRVIGDALLNDNLLLVCKPLNSFNLFRSSIK